MGFIDIPGNEDLAVKGNVLYADLYTDLVCLDVSNPLHVVVKNYNDGVFPFRSYAGGFYGDTSKSLLIGLSEIQPSWKIVTILFGL